jgi:hypothetical protein
VQAGGGTVLKTWPQQPGARTVHLVHAPLSATASASPTAEWTAAAAVSYQWLLDTAAACDVQPLSHYVVATRWRTGTPAGG